MSEKQIVTQASRPIYPYFIWVLVSQHLLSHINVSMVSLLGIGHNYQEGGGGGGRVKK